MPGRSVFPLMSLTLKRSSAFALSSKECKHLDQKSKMGPNELEIVEGS